MPCTAGMTKGWMKVSLKNGVWHKADIDKPKMGERVICVKETKSGTRALCFGAWFDKTEYYPEGHWVTGGGNNNVIYWMPAPKIPED